MQQIIKNISQLFLIGLAFVLLFGCSRITQENFDKIKPDMTMQEVISILGEPTSSESINIAGVSGTAATWKNRDAEINIQFLNERVIVKNFSKAGSDNKNNNKTVHDEDTT